jgi:hypothetical protein
VPAFGVPERTAVPVPLVAPSVTPAGSAPVTVMRFATGVALVVIVKVPAAPAVKVVAFALVIATVWFTVSVKFCVALAPTPLAAVKTSGKVPAAVAVPESTPVAGLKATPAGSAPVIESVGAGKPVATTVCVPAVPTWKVAAAALAIAGAWLTVSVKVCVPLGVTPPLDAVIVSVKTPPGPVGVPERTAVPVPLVAPSVTPAGKAPPMLMLVAVGVALVVIVKVPACPTVNVVALALVIATVWFTVSVKFCVALGATPLLAVMTSGNVPGTVGVPESTPVVLLKVTPAGNAPATENVGAGKPVAVTVNVPAVPTLNMVALALVIAGADCVLIVTVASDVPLMLEMR